MILDEEKLPKCLEKPSHVVKDNGAPFGYAFSIIDNIDVAEKHTYPDWAPTGVTHMGFYPD